MSFMRQVPWSRTSELKRMHLYNFVSSAKLSSKQVVQTYVPTKNLRIPFPRALTSDVFNLLNFWQPNKPKMASRLNFPDHALVQDSSFCSSVIFIFRLWTARSYPFSKLFLLHAPLLVHLLNRQELSWNTNQIKSPSSQLVYRVKFNPLIWHSWTLHLQCKCKHSNIINNRKYLLSTSCVRF